MCAHCFAAGGLWQRTPLRRCSACCLAWYCGKDCQRADRTRRAAASDASDVDARAATPSPRRVRRARRHAAECRKGRKELRDAVRAAEARRLDGLLPANGDRPALRARHRLDGYGKSAMVLYEAAAVDDIYGVVTRPCHDAGMRERLKAGEAIFNVGDYADVVRDLVEAGLVTPLDYNGPLEEGRAFGRIEVVLPEPGEEEPEVVEEPALEDVAASKTSNE